MSPSLLRIAVVATLLTLAPAAGAAPTFWGQFPTSPVVDTPYALPLGPGSQVTATISTGGTQGLNGADLDTLGRAATGLDYDNLYCLGVFNGGGQASVPTSITFSNAQVGAQHKRGLLMVGAVNGFSSPITVTSSVPGRVATWTVVGAFAYGLSNSFSITWDAGAGIFVTAGPIANDSKCIAIDLGDLESDGTITVSLSQWLDDGILFALGEEWLSDVAVPQGSTGAVTFHPLHPNPARSSSTLAFSVPATSRARIELFDVNGRRLATLADREFDAGHHTVNWDLRDDAGAPVPAGLVFARLSTPTGALTRRLLVTR
jgi:hypothetical protein